MIRERVIADMARARKASKVFGRPKVSASKEAAARARLAAGAGILKTTKQLRIDVSTVQRIKAEMAGR